MAKITIDKNEFSEMENVFKKTNPLKGYSSCIHAESLSSRSGYVCNCRYALRLCLNSEATCERASVRAWVRACVHAYVRACVRTCVRVRACICVRAYACAHKFLCMMCTQKESTQKHTTDLLPLPQAQCLLPLPLYKW